MMALNSKNERILFTDGGCIHLDTDPGIVLFIPVWVLVDLDDCAEEALGVGGGDGVGDACHPTREINLR